MRRLPFVLAALALAPAARAQTARRDSAGTAPDTLRVYEVAPVVVTATRTARSLADVPVPTTVVTRAQIDAQRPLRLSDLLAEQPGLALLDGIGGAGLQIQGFDPDYTLVLIDGEPVVGRTAGTLDLDRLTVANVERVEVVRGPSSSRYGSDALAGVVNLITRRPGTRTSGEVTARAETHGTTDLTVQGEAGSDAVGARVLLNRFGSAGYDLRPDLPGRTTPAFDDYTAELKLRARPARAFGGRADLGLAVRGGTQRQRSVFALGDALYDDRGTRDEWSVTPTLRLRLADRLHLDGGLHAARFVTASRATARADGSAFDATDYDQTYAKAEATATALPTNRLAVYAGGGVIREGVGGDRYADARSALQGFGFVEAEWGPRRWLDLNTSARYDRHADYAPRLSPKLALLVRPAPGVRLRASVGSGFKAPAFRQRYLTFTNATAGGYSVFGANEVAERLAAFEAAGALDTVLIRPEGLGGLRAENSVAYSAGGELDLAGGAVTLRANVFRNSVRDLIETQAIAVKTNGQSVFTYFNLARIYTQGVEAEASWDALRGRARVVTLRLAASYQLLDTADRDVLGAIAAGTVYGRDAQNRDYRVERADYGGLLGRSRHSGTVRADVAAARLGLGGSARLVWRGRFGDRDLNGNAILDDAREYVPGYATLNLTLNATRGPVVVTGTVRNALGYTDADRVPGLPGRLLALGASYRF